MDIEKVITKFHQQLQYQPQAGSIKQLPAHHFAVNNDFHPRKPAVRVRNFHFTPLRVDYYFPQGALIRQTSGEWHSAETEDEQLQFKDAIKTALQALYLLSIPLGECIVQRQSSNLHTVFSVKTQACEQLNDSEIQKITHFIYKGKTKLKPTYGTDIECMIYNPKTRKWVSASSFLSRNDSVGFDDAISVHGTKVSHPILELRPNPAETGEQLYNHVLSEYEKLKRYLSQNELIAVGGGNPYSRFFLGGHLHVGNQRMTFKHVQNLDLFLTLPAAAAESEQTASRRTRFGRFGNVRENRYNGYEYRSLSSWYNLIPDSLPILQWFQYLNEYPHRFPSIPWTQSLLAAYYEQDKTELFDCVSSLKNCCESNLPHEEFSKYAMPFFQFIEENLGQNKNHV